MVTSRFSTSFAVTIASSRPSRCLQSHAGIGTGSGPSCLMITSGPEPPPTASSPVRHSRKMSPQE